MKTLRTKLLLFLALILLIACESQTSQKPENLVHLGRFGAEYDPKTNNVSFQPVPDVEVVANPLSLSPYGLTYNDTTGWPGSLSSYIEDTNFPVYPNEGWQFRYLALVTPYSCTAEYNEVTQTLSFGVNLINFTSSTYYSDSRYIFKNGSADYDQTFYAPFYFKLYHMDTDIVTAVNTNLATAECGANGLSLANDDVDSNKRFDCISPDQDFAADPTGELDPGWDFSDFVTNGDMTPGESIGCQVFFQFTLTENTGFFFAFDMQAIHDDGTLPNAPEVTSPSDGTYRNTGTINVDGTNVGTSCNPAGTVYVEGGASTASSACAANGTFSVNVTLNQNQDNNLKVYQIVSSKQSASSLLTIVHDNIPPTVLAKSPTDGETQVNRSTNCTFTFSEPMDTSTFSTGTNCSNGTFSLCRGGTFLAGSISFTANDSVAIFTPTSKPLRQNSSHSCTATTGLTDLAGNAMAANEVSTFTTARNNSEYTDNVPPAVQYTVPADNATVSPSSEVVVYFNEPINASTINNVDAACSNSVPNLAVYEFPGCGCGGSGVVPGSFSLGADGSVATFSPTASSLSANSCYMLAAQGCIEDLAGNQLPNRQNLVACGSATFNYNILYLFFTDGGTDTTGPTVVHTSPALGETGVDPTVVPFFVFSEPLSPSTIISDYFYMNKFGFPAKLAVDIASDATLQIVKFKPNSPLTTASSDIHVLTATGTVADLIGNLAPSPQTSQFTITATPDTAPPTVTKVVPSVSFATSPGACGSAGNYISKCSTFDVYFSEPIDKTTLNTANVELINVGGSPCSSTVKKPAAVEIFDDGLGVRVTPVSSMRSGNACGGNRRRYYVQVSGIKDRAGNTIASTFQSTIFSACAETDVPDVTEIVPPNGGTIASNGNWVVFFDEPMDKSTMTSANIGASSCLPIVTAAADGRSAVVNCAFNIGGGGTLTIDRNLRDFYNSSTNASCEIARGNRMAADVTATYSVGGTDTTAPTVSNLNDISPLDQATAVATTVTPSITFSEAIDPRTVTNSSIFIVDTKGRRVRSTFSYSNGAQTITLTPANALLDNTVYYLIATTAVRDLGGSLNYDGAGGENTEIANVLRTCFATGGGTCP